MWESSPCSGNSPPGKLVSRQIGFGCSISSSAPAVSGLLIERIFLNRNYFILAVTLNYLSYTKLHKITMNLRSTSS